MCYINHAIHSAELAASGGHPLSGCAGLTQREACHWILSRLTAPYSTAITDSLDSQVAIAPLRIQFAGVTPVPLPPRKRWDNKSDGKDLFPAPCAK